MTDVIVIGAGGGGAVVAKELASRGLDVLVLEAGPYFTDPEQEWTHFEDDSNNPLWGFFRFGPSDRGDPAWFREWAQNSFLWQLAGVGGTTLHYYGNSPRTYPGVFAGYDGPDADAYDTAHRFPFTYAEFVPYLEWVEHTLPVQTAAMGTKEATYFRGCEGIGLPVNTSKHVTEASFRPQENAILQPGGNAGLVTETVGNVDALAYPNATGCTFCGYCFQGCYEPVRAPINLKAKRSTNISYIPMALTADQWSAGGRPIRLRPDSFVTRIHTGGGRATGVTWRDTTTGEVLREDATVVVMAGGCTENPRLWVNSGLPDPNDWVGRGYTDHFFDWVVGVMPEPTGSFKGVGSSARCDFPGIGGLENVGLPPAIQAFSLTFSDQGIQGYYGNGLAGPGAWDGAGRLVGSKLKEVMAKLPYLLNVLVITDDDVEAQNRVVPSALSADEHGPVAKVEFRQRHRTARTLSNREFLANRAGELLRAAGATEVLRIGWPPLILHVQSSMRMGEDEANSVLDTACESRAVKGLFIADNSALPNGLGGPNPTLSCQALATRTAEQIVMRYFGGDPWVGVEAPVSSIDDVVTAAVLDQGLTVAPASHGAATRATLSPHVGAAPRPLTASHTVSPAGLAGPAGPAGSAGTTDRARAAVRRSRSIAVSPTRSRTPVGADELAPAVVAATAAAAVLHQAVKLRERTRPPATDETTD